MSKADLQLRYDTAKKAALGSAVSCPTCQGQFVKAKNDQAFCSSKGKGNCKDAYWTSIRSKRVAARAVADPTTEVSDAQRAIEHAEYLAQAAIDFLNLADEYQAVLQGLHEGEDLDGDALEQRLDELAADITESRSHVQLCVHEFRKRAVRAKVGGHGAA